MRRQISFTIISTAGIDTNSLLFGGGMTLGPYGNIFGAAFQGGKFDEGAVYEIDTATNAFSLVHSFNFQSSTEGNSPFGDVNFDSNGNLYGTTYFGEKQSLRYT